eukprot:g2834.t1
MAAIAENALPSPSTARTTAVAGNGNHKNNSNIIEKRGDVVYSKFVDETELPAIMELIGRDLSEPYSIFTYRYFISTWPEQCILARVDGKLVGVIVSKAERREKTGRVRGYIAMLSVDSAFRKRSIGSTLAKMSVACLRDEGKCDEIILEAEWSNQGALRLYAKLGFVRDKRLPKYYLNGSDAYRLKLWLK